MYDYISNAFRAICNAPSKVLFPPINPAACTKIQPGIPDLVDNSSSLRPRHSAGNGFLFSKLSEVIGIAWILCAGGVLSGNRIYKV